MLNTENLESKNKNYFIWKPNTVELLGIAWSEYWMMRLKHDCAVFHWCWVNSVCLMVGWRSVSWYGWDLIIQRKYCETVSQHTTHSLSLKSLIKVWRQAHQEILHKPSKKEFFWKKIIFDTTANSLLWLYCVK